VYNETEILSRFLDVLHFGARELANLDDYAAYWEEEGGAFLRKRDKVAAEALLLAFLASRVQHLDTRLEPAVEALSEAARTHIDTPRNEALLRRFPQTVATLGGGFILLAALGRARPGIEGLLRSALARGFASLSERSIFRLMDTRWSFALLDPGLVRPAEELVPLSTLGAAPHPIYTMTEDDYAVTHALFYLTDFGQKPGVALDFTGSEPLDTYLGWNAVRGDLDLLGEFLMAALALRPPVSPAFRFAWELLFRAWDENDGLTGPNFSAQRFAGLPEDAAAAYAFAENYHTVFVGGILCAVALMAPPVNGGKEELGSRTGHSTPTSRSSSVPEKDLPEWIVARLLMVRQESVAPAPLWLRVVQDCDLSREELAGVLYDALLVTAARQYSLVQLAEALVAGACYAWLRSPTFGRALEFLLDQQLPDGSVGIHRLLAWEDHASPPAEAQAAIAGALAQIAATLRPAA
jgi:hypothetical protein